MIRIRPIRITQRFRASPRRVFEAWLDPDIAGRWLFATAARPMTEVAIDARVGGAFRLARQHDGEIVEHRGHYEQIVPHRRLVFRLAGTSRPRESTRVTVVIAPRGRGCELRLRHTNVSPDRAEDIGAHWVGMLYGLGQTLAALTSRRKP